MQSNQDKTGRYDIAIVGGGPAGLQAALVLARTRKSIIVFDDPRPPRNGASHGVHNVLGLDGLRPAEIREVAWKQIDVYKSATLCEEQVAQIKKGDDDRFEVTGNNGTVVSAAQVILAAGYRDVYPEVSGFTDCWADTIISCPFCDGYENRDRVWGIVAPSEMHAHHFPKMLLNWTSHVKLLLQAGVSIDAAYREELLAAGIAIHEGDITQIKHSGSEVEGVVLETGEAVEVKTLLWIPAKKPLGLIESLVNTLGLALDEEGYVKTDEMQQTNVTGLWAVGDVQSGRSGALDAAHTGLMAAFMIIRDWHG